MKISALLSTSNYRGDHSKDCMIAIDVKEGETVAALTERILNERTRTDHIELRIVAEEDKLAD